MGSKSWRRTRYHEAAHSVIAWKTAMRPKDVIGDIAIKMEDGRLVASAFLEWADRTYITPDALAKVGIAGFLGEAKAVVEFDYGEAKLAETKGLSWQVMCAIYQHEAKLIPEDKGWRIPVAVTPASKLTVAIASEDDIRYVAAATPADEKAVTPLVTAAIGLLETPAVWNAVRVIAGMIPKRVGSWLSGNAIKEALAKLLP
jgi:hypothetical protein